LNLFEKRGDSLYRITGADIHDAFAGLRDDLLRMSAAARLTNFVAAVSGEGDVQPSVFETLLRGLHVLDSGHDPALTALLFQIKLLGETGFRPQTDHCAVCGEGRDRKGSRHFSPLAGGLVCQLCARRDRDHCLPLSPGSLALLQQALRWTPAAMTRLKAAGQ
ncbi:MAG: DNA repair protein RecO, partial [Nitrospira sp.]